MIAFPARLRVPFCFGLIATATLTVSCDVQTPDGAADQTIVEQASPLIASAKRNWLQFGGDPGKSGSNASEVQLTSANVGQLQPLSTFWAGALPGSVSGTPVLLTDVNFGGQLHDVLYASADATIVALDAYTGEILWSDTPGSSPSCPGTGGTSSYAPAVDPSLAFVYHVGGHGCVHKYNVAGGEVMAGGFPAPFTTKPSTELTKSALTIGTAGASSYLYVQTTPQAEEGSGDAQGHLTAINLANGTEKTFNASCSNLTGLLGPNPCANVGNHSIGAWGRGGPAFSTAMQRVYLAMGDNPFSPNQHVWGDTILALNANGSGGSTGNPVDSYTPANNATLYGNDLDLGSTNAMVLPSVSSKYPHVAAVTGKSGVLRLVNLDNMSGWGANQPGHATAPDGVSDSNITSIAINHNDMVMSPMATWTNPADNTIWIFAPTSDALGGGTNSGVNAYRITVDANGNPTVTFMWEKLYGFTGGLTVAADVLYFSLRTGTLMAVKATTGDILAGPLPLPAAIHMNTPLVVNGIVYAAAGSTISAYSPSGAKTFTWSQGQPPKAMINYVQGVCTLTGFNDDQTSTAANQSYIALDKTSTWVLYGSGATSRTLTASCVPWADLNASHASTPSNVYTPGALSGAPAPLLVPPSQCGSTCSGSPQSRAMQRSGSVAGEHQHYFTGATKTLPASGNFAANDKLFVWVYVPSGDVPSEVMLQFHDTSGTSTAWEHRAYWGANKLNWGTSGSASRFQVSTVVPAAGGWKNIAVTASQVGLTGLRLDGMAFTLFDGSAYWDDPGYLVNGGGAEQNWFDDAPPPGAALFSDVNGVGSQPGDGWVWITKWLSGASNTVGGGAGTNLCFLSGFNNTWPTTNVAASTVTLTPGTTSTSWTEAQTGTVQGSASVTCVDNGLAATGLGARSALYAFSPSPTGSPQLALSSNNNLCGLLGTAGLLYNFTSPPSVYTDLAAGYPSIWEMASYGNPSTFGCYNLRGWRSENRNLSKSLSVSGGEAPEVVGLDGAGKPWMVDFKGHGWHPLPSITLVGISAAQFQTAYGHDGTFVYYFDGGSWQSVSSTGMSGSITSVVASGGTPWLITSTGVFNWRWVQVGSTFQQQFAPVTITKDPQSPGTGVIKQIAVGYDNDAWAIDTGGYTYHYDLNATAFIQFNGASGTGVTSLSVGDANNVWGTIPTLAGIRKFSGGGWNRFGTQPNINVVAAGTNGAGNTISDVWAVDTSFNIYHLDATGTLIKVPGNVRTLAVGGPGFVWGRDSGNAVLSYSGD